MTSSIKTKRSNDLPKYAFNFYYFDSLPMNILLSLKYYIIFYHKICGIQINKKIESIQHLLKLQNADVTMCRLSDDEYEGELLFADRDKEEDEIIAQQLKTLQIADINKEKHYLPTTIIHIYMHEIANNNQSMVQWIGDILATCDNNCVIFRDTHFDKSNLDNTSINILCNALMLRTTQLFRLRNLFFSGNKKINDECIEKLL
eukprot:UN03109